MSDQHGREQLAQFGMTDAELDAWFYVTAIAGDIGELYGWHSLDTHDMVHAAHVVQNFLLSRPVKRAGRTSRVPDAGEDRGAPVSPGTSASRTAPALATAGLTNKEIELCLRLANVAELIHALPEVPGDEWHACTHALRHIQGIIIAQAVARASGLPRPVFGAYEEWAPDPSRIEQSRAAVAQAGLTGEEIDACVAIAAAAQQVRSLDVQHPTAWHDSMHLFRAALDGVLHRAGSRAQRQG